MGYRGLSKHDVEEKKRRDDRIRKLHAQSVACRWIVRASVGGALNADCGCGAFSN
jgi:hypothetical protein